MTTVDYELARERLFAAELATVLERAAPVRRPRGPRLAAAAMLVLGLGVTAGTVWLQRAAATSAQEPLPLPAEVRAERSHELGDLGDDLGNLMCWFDAPRDLARLQRFTQLRRLAVAAYDPSRSVGIRVLGPHRDWAKPPDEVLGPLAALRALEVLRLPSELALRSEHLVPLQQLPRLRELKLGATVRLDESFVTALAQLPALRVLELDGLALDPDAIGRLSVLALESLRLRECSGLDDRSLSAIAGLAALRSLHFDGLARAAIAATAAEQAAIRRPTRAAFASLQALPHLVELSVDRSEVGDDVLMALPDRLTRLSLYSTTGYTEVGLQSLRRLGGLRHLQWRERSGYGFFEAHRIEPVVAARALAEALSTLRLESFDYTGALTTELAQALALQLDLRTLFVCRMVESGRDTKPDLAALAGAPALQHLRLFNQSALTDDDLEPLAACRALHRVEIWSSGAVTQGGAAALLPGVAVEVVTLAEWMRRK